MKFNTATFTLFFLFGLNLNATETNLIHLQYGKWQIWYNCENRGYQVFNYTTVPDGGNLNRYSKFHQESTLPLECQQFSTSSYKSPKDSIIKYDRGHGVHQNIWDHSRELMIKSNSMANIVPQASKLNRHGVWRFTEVLTECFRDLGKVEVWGGVVWGNDQSNDLFVKSHGVVTPDYLWKLIIFPQGEVNAWLIPNDNSPISKNIDNYLVAPSFLEKKTGVHFTIPDNEKFEADKIGLTKPQGCSIK